MDYLLHIAFVIGIYALLAITVNILGGYAGLLTVSQGAIFGLGAYGFALATMTAGLPVGVGLLAAAFLPLLLNVVLAWMGLRLRSDYFVLLTLGFQVIFQNIVLNWINLTGGPFGIAGIRPLGVPWLPIRPNIQLTIIVWSSIAIALIAHRVIQVSPIGLVLRTMREDTLLAESLGRHVTAYQIVIFAASSVLAGLAGALYASYYSFIEPTPFLVSESILFIAIVMLGGLGTVFGPVLGATILIGIPELLRFAGLPNAQAANLRQILYGVAIVVIVAFRPTGLLGGYDISET